MPRDLPNKLSAPIDSELSRRDFLRQSGAVVTVASVPLLGIWSNAVAEATSAPAARTFALNQEWFFAGPVDATDVHQSLNDSGFEPVTLPHCVTSLSWQKWDPASWQHQWRYHRRFSLAGKLTCGERVFVEFDRVMATATLSINGHSLPQHLGGFLPFEREITDHLQEENVLSMEVDSRWIPIPPAGSPVGPISVDYLLPGGINGLATLRSKPT